MIMIIMIIHYWFIAQLLLNRFIDLLLNYFQ